MQVFKVYFQILRRHVGQIFLYVGIFAVIVFGFILPSVDTNPVESFTAKKCLFAVFDSDKSEASRALIGWLSEKHEPTEIANDREATVQDALYNRNVYGVLRISEGYEAALAAGASAGELAKRVELLTVPGTLTGELFATDLNRYLTLAALSCRSGASVTEALAATEDALQISLKTELSREGAESAQSKLYYFFSYLSYVFAVMSVVSIAPVLNVFRKPEVHTRISCSSYPFHRMNWELLLGVFLTGLFFLAFFGGWAGIVFGGELLCARGALYLLNLLLYLAVGLALAYLVSQLATTQDTINMIANTISLGMSFLCGVFVPMKYLGDTVLAIAHFLPAYWYQKTLMLLQEDYSGEMGTICGNFAMLVLFVAAFVAAGLVAARQKSLRQLA